MSEKDKKIKIKVYCNTGFAGCNYENIIEIPIDKWKSMTKTEQDDFLDQLAFDNFEEVPFDEWYQIIKKKQDDSLIKSAFDNMEYGISVLEG